MRILHIIAAFICISFQIHQEINVTIEVYTDDDQDTVQVFIAGNNQQMGNWDPGKINLKKISVNLWAKTFKYPINTPIEYKITKGKWENEAADDRGNPFPNYILNTQKDTTVRHNVHFWKKAGNSAARAHVTGNVVIHKNIKSGNLKPRDVAVWLPPDYMTNNERHYPVLYMQDGQNVFDPHTSFLNVDWQIDESADSLIRSGVIEPLIIVAINNTEDRNEEYSPTAKGKEYRDFIIHFLKPLIDKTYRTIPDAKYSCVGGSSSGGILAFMLVWENPHVFSKAICMSPAFKIGQIDYVKNVVEDSNLKKEIKLYIYNGGIGLEEELQPGIDEMMLALEKKGYQHGKDIFWRKDQKAIHNEVAWAKHMTSVLKLFYEKK